MAGYSGIPLVRKLGINENVIVTVLGAPTHYRKLLDPLPARVRFSDKIAPGCAFVHLFTTKRVELTRLVAHVRKQMADDGVLWVSWPKKSSGVTTDITEDTVREVALPLGLVDTKVCAVDETWSGLKLMVRRELRTHGRAR
jgi:hypothetical protein